MVFVFHSVLCSGVVDRCAVHIASDNIPRLRSPRFQSLSSDSLLLHAGSDRLSVCADNTSMAPHVWVVHDDCRCVRYISRWLIAVGLCVCGHFVDGWGSAEESHVFKILPAILL